MKRHPALLELSREHHTALSLANRVRKHLVSGDSPAIETARVEVLARFAEELEPHFVEEEGGLLVTLAARGEAALVERTLDEHVRLRALVAALERAVGPELAKVLAAFAELLNAHVRFEERELFERAQAFLPASGEP